MGTMINDGAFTYAYDEENRLTTVERISDSAVVSQYQYDALSRRAHKIADPAGTPITTVFYHDGARAIEKKNSLAVTSSTYVYRNYAHEVLTMDTGALGMPKKINPAPSSRHQLRYCCK